MRELGDDVTDSRTQPFIVKDREGVNPSSMEGVLDLSDHISIGEPEE